MADKTVWIIDDDKGIRWVLEKALTRAGYVTHSFEDARQALRQLPRGAPAALFTDVRMPGLDGLSFLKQLRASQPALPVIIMTAHSDLDSAVAAYEGGAFDYLPKPFDVEEAVQLARRAIEAGQRETPAASAGEDAASADIIGAAPAMQEVFRAIGRLSRSVVTVLITGESGAGKELVARALHRHSPRASRPFIALNMAAIPRDLLESELFGHEKGAFTGAQARREGRFEQAHGGTLFLDEIGDMPAELQTRLLRVLADGEFYRVGGQSPVKVDVRIIAATHQDLAVRVQAGLFREDLFHRLNVIRVRLPALRERREDIPLLVQHFLKRAAQELQVEPKTLREDALEVLMRYTWPGNVRELENVCRWITVMAPGLEAHAADLPDSLRTAPTAATGATQTAAGWEAVLTTWVQSQLHAGGPLPDVVARVEQLLMQATLEHTGGRRQEAAKLLGWGRNTLTRKLAAHGEPHTA
jgi:two-component system nitrogen regulation response regulator GlnG